MDIEHVLFAAVDLYESDLTRGQSETIFYDQAERFAKAAIKISKELVEGEPVDYDLRILVDEAKKPDWGEVGKNPELFEIFKRILKTESPNLRVEKLMKFSEDFLRTEPRDKESPLKLVWERFGIELALEIIPEITPAADRLFELFRMVLKTHPSEPTQKFLGRLARCYIWGFEAECVILCRAVLDTAFKDAVDNEVCEKYSNKRPSNKRPYDNFTLVDRIYAAEKEGLINEATRKLAKKVKARGDKAVHYQPDITKDILGTMRDTLVVIERLQNKSRKP
jgi:hypothetical protein